MALALSYSPLYSEGISSKARFPRERYRLTRDGLEPCVRDGSIRLVEPQPVDEATLARVHDPGYVRRFLTGTLDEVEVRRIGIRPWTPQFVPRALTLTGGTLSALRSLREGARYAGNMAGGTHHAFADRGGGYCVFNDLALAAVVALEDWWVERVVVVDLDVHQGDGTAAIFADEPRVTTLSLHGRKNYPSRKQRSDLDVPLEDETGDAAYLAALDEVLPALLDAKQPELILYQAGVDPLADDALGRLSLSREGLHQRNCRVFDEADRRGLPVLITMGGGYAKPIERSVACHVDLFAEAARRAVRAGAQR